MGRAFVYVILGGGVAAGYAALEFSRRRVQPGQLCIISEEPAAPYERPALSKGYLLPEAPVRLPAFHTCVGAGDERLTPEWYREKGIELVLSTAVVSVNTGRKTLLTEYGETISYRFLIVATGARAMRLEEVGVAIGDVGVVDNVCYLRGLTDADKFVDAMRSCAAAGGKVVVVGGGYIGMECAAALVANGIRSVTMVFPGKHLISRFFTPEIAGFYQGYYEQEGVKFIKGAIVTSLETSVSTSRGNKMVRAVVLKDGRRLPADLVVVGIGARANTGLFEGQLDMAEGGIKVNGRMQTSNASVYAVGDVAAFPVKLFGGETRRFEHVDAARKTAKHAVGAIMAADETDDLNYMPFFYSRVFELSWQFYGHSRGDVVHYDEAISGGGGESTAPKFGAYWVSSDGTLQGAFLEGGTKEENEAIASAVRSKAAVKDLDDLQTEALRFALRLSDKDQNAQQRCGGRSMGAARGKLIRTRLQACTAGAIVVAISIVVFAWWYARNHASLLTDYEQLSRFINGRF